MTDAPDPDVLIQELAHEDELHRQRARHELVFLGDAALPALERALTSPDRNVRWEAAKALACHPRPAVAAALGRALADEDDGVSWLAAMTLIQLGDAALRPTLEAIVAQRQSCHACASAHHVLHELRRGEHAELVDPVIEAIESADRHIRAPVAAERALLALQRARS